MLHNLLNKQIVRYILAGGLAFMAEILVLLSLNKLLGMSATIATAVAFWVGLCASFGLQKIIAFNDYQKELRAISRQIVLYLLLVLTNYGFTVGVVSIFDEKHLLISRTGALVATTLWNFFVYNNLIFKSRKPRDTVSLPTAWSRLLRRIRNNKMQAAFTLLSLFLLVVVSVYGAIQSGPASATNSDAIINTYLAQDGILEPHQIRLLPNHTNALKVPALWLQAQLPYNYATFIVGNAVLIISTCLLWCIVLARIFGKRSLGISALGITFFLFLSPLLQFNLAYTTVRNIEFPLTLYFIAVFFEFLVAQSTSRRLLLETGLSAILFSLVVASDKYFLYVIAPILFIVALIYVAIHSWHQSKLQYQMAIKVALVPATALAALSLIKIFEILGLFVYDTLSGAKIAIVQKDMLYPSIRIATEQLLNMTGADIFGQRISLSFIGALGSLLVVMTSTLGLLLSLWHHACATLRSTRETNAQDLFMIGISIISCSVFIVYIISGQVVVTLPDGSISNAGQERYLAMLPFLMVIGLVWMYQNILKTANSKIILIIIMIFSMIFGSQYAYTQYRSRNTISEAWKTSFNSVIQKLDEEQVTVVATGHWYGATLRFWSGGNISPVVIQNCNQQVSFLVRDEWYVPEPYGKSAILVDKTGIDSQYLSCPNHRLESIFGAPYKRALAIGTDGKSNVELLFFNYDIRNKLRAVSLH